MRIEHLEYQNVDYRDDLLSRLHERVFHVTTQQIFELIQNDGAIRNNKDGRFSNCWENSFARKRGWVPLFDLRGKDIETIEATLLCYYFLGPDQFKVFTPDYSEYELSLAYLFLNQESFANIIPNEEGKRMWEEEGAPYPRFVPKSECWYPGDIPLACIDKVLWVTMRKSIDAHARACLQANEPRKVQVR